MTIAEDRQSISDASKVQGIPRSYPTETDKPEVPCTMVGNPIGDYDETFGGEYTQTYPVLLLWSRSPGTDRAIAALDDYLETSGPKSIKAAIEEAMPNAKVARWRDYGAYEFAGVEYPGVTFEVQVL